MKISMSHLHWAFRNQQRYVNIAVARLRHVDFDTIVYTGHSDALVAPAVAYLLRKYIIVIRKAGDDTHSHLEVEGNFEGSRYVIVDDFISHGETVRRIKRLMDDCSSRHQLVGLCMYRQTHRKRRGFGHVLEFPESSRPANIFNAFTLAERKQNGTARSGNRTSRQTALVSAGDR